MEPDALAGVGFDLDHTLAIDNKLERVAFLRLLEFVVENGGNTLGTLDEEIERVDALLALQRGGAFSIDDAVRRFVAERGLRPSDAYVKRFRDMALDMAGQFIVPLPGAKRVFQTLRERGIRMAVLSNGWNPLQIRKARAAGFDGTILASGDIGEQKPARRTFEALLDVLGTPPERSWYVGDDPRGDVEGARNAGLHAVWIDAERKIYPPGLPPPERTIVALEELLAILPSPAPVS
jgi:HAD superfamily hydrolase (TIGR01509 family)